MLYSIVKIGIRSALKFFCRKITISDPGKLSLKGPLLLACNHPNSFLDAIIVGSHFNQPVHFLARGDAFRKPFARKILSALKMIPIYRLSEGREHLALNDATFEQCRNILLSGGIVLIFSEGLCVHQWLLQSLKKGSARIAIDAWHQPAMAQRFRVLPVSLNYNSFESFGKNIIIHFGEMITLADIPENSGSGESIHYFNRLLTERLETGMLLSGGGDEQIIPFLVSNYAGESSENTISQLKPKQEILKESGFNNILLPLKQPYRVAPGRLVFAMNYCGTFLLAIPAIAGWLFHFPLYSILKKAIRRKTAGTVFFDSVLFGSLLLIYPLYWLCLTLLAALLFGNDPLTFLFAGMPALAWVTVTWKVMAQSVHNYIRLRKRGREIMDQVFA